MSVMMSVVSNVMLGSWCPVTFSSCGVDFKICGLGLAKLYCKIYMEYEVEGSRPRGRIKRTWRKVVEKDCQARKLNKEDAMDRSRWRKLKDVWWSRWMWVGECYFWYRLARVVQYKGLLNSCVCVRVCVIMFNAVCHLVLLYACSTDVLSFFLFSPLQHPAFKVTSNTLPAGWAWTVFSWMPQRQNSYGLFHHIGTISFRHIILQLALFRWHQPPQYATSASTWTATCQWGRTLPGSCARASAIGILRHIRSIRRSVPRWTLLTLISSFVMSKLDYCNVALTGLPSCDLIVCSPLSVLQSIINAAAQPHHCAPCVCTCFGILRQIRSIRRSIPRSTLSMLISSFVMSKLDYCNVALAGLPAATWTVCSPSSTLPRAWQLARSATTTSLRFLPTSTGCAYLSASSTSCAYWSTSAYMGPHRATCRTPFARSRVPYHQNNVQQRATAPSLSQVLVPGTVCQMQSVAAHC